MRTIRLNFTIPEEIAERLREKIAERGRSAFIAEAIKERLDEMEREQFRLLMAEGYRVRREEDREMDQEWEAATLENWS